MYLAAIPALVLRYGATVQRVRTRTPTQVDMKVAVFGLGYVGTVSAACLAANGHDVWGVDPDELKVAAVASGTSPIVEPGLQALVAQAVASGKLHASVRPADALDNADVSLLCVGTPSATSGETNLAYIYRVVEELAQVLTDPVSPRPFHTVVIRSTVPPGTVEDVNAVLQSAFHDGGPDVGVAMCPEFLREGTGIADFFAPPYTVIGATDLRAIDAVSRLFSFLEAPVRVVHPRTAESLKYACNAFHATKISFANDMGRIFSRLGVDSREVMELFCEDTFLNISPKYLRPGFAFGGSCLPKDIRALLYLARAESVDIPLLSGVLASNRLSIDEAIDRVVAGAGHRVAMLGLSFKPDSDDLRESPYVDLAETLLGKGYEVRIHDPVLNPSSLVGANRQYVESRLPHLKRILTDTPEEAIAEADIAIVSHSTNRVVEALLASPPLRVLDLDGRLGAELEALGCYEGFAW
ncbi:MAG: UDP-glucose/GDP-mannose dehydrogenase family protein [Acidimicrobiales bacterium]